MPSTPKNVEPLRRPENPIRSIVAELVAPCGKTGGEDGIHSRIARMSAFLHPQSPRSSRAARELVGHRVSSYHSGFQHEYYAFDLGAHTGESGFTGGHKEYAKNYRTRTGAGELRYHTDDALSITRMGSYTRTGHIYDPYTGWSKEESGVSRRVDTTDYHYTYISQSLPRCDPASYYSYHAANSDQYSERIIPDVSLWSVDSPTSATVLAPGEEPPYGGIPGELYGKYVCSGADASITLSEQWSMADLISFFPVTAEMTLTTGNPDLVGGWARLSAADATDGTNMMIRVVMKYRIRPSDRDRHMRWREVLRDLIPDPRPPAHLSTPTSHLHEYRSENVGLLTRPYYDAFGAWGPTDMQWDDAAEQMCALAATGQTIFPMVRRGGWGFGDWAVEDTAKTPTLYASQFRLWCSVPGVASVRWTIVGAAQVTVAMGSDGFSERHELSAPATDPASWPDVSIGTTSGAGIELLAADGAIIPYTLPARAGVNAQLRLLWRSRTIWRVGGWAPFQVGAAPVPMHTYYRERTWLVDYRLDATADPIEGRYATQRVQRWRWSQSYDAATGDLLPSVQTHLAQAEWESSMTVDGVQTMHPPPARLLSRGRRDPSSEMAADEGGLDQF